GLGAIFHHPKSVFLRGQKNSIHVRRMSVKMNWKNSDRSCAHRVFQKIDIDAVSLVDVDEDGPRAAMNHRFDRWKRGVRWNENLVARTNCQRLKQHHRSARPIRTEHDFV